MSAKRTINELVSKGGLNNALNTHKSPRKKVSMKRTSNYQRPANQKLYIEPDSFYVSRRRAGLTTKAAAEMLDINERTIRNWEKGKSRIPYAAFRLMRVMAGYEFIDKRWDGWSFFDGALWTPEGRRFEPHELRYVGTYISLARGFLEIKDRSPSNDDIEPWMLAQEADEQKQQYKGLETMSDAIREKAPANSENYLRNTTVESIKKITSNGDVESEVA